MIDRKCIYLLLCSLIFMFLGLFINVKIGKSISGPCSECHTMHNSQNNTSMSYNSTLNAGPFGALVRGDCAICHTGSNQGLGSTTHIPHVASYTEPGYRFNGTTLTGDSNNPTLAGGSFYWVASFGCGTDAKGHNVAGIADNDSALSTPPGYDPSNYDRPSSWNQQLKCAGAYGCHGDPSKNDPFAAISGAHHKNIIRGCGTASADTVATSYRFLLGIKGVEDSNWEYDYDSNDHNGYYAVDLYNTGVTNPSQNSGSINYLCGECHGNFHWNSTTGCYTSPWLRHPTDIDMNNYIGTSKEYQNYPGPFDTNGTYFPDVPVGTDDGSDVNYVWDTGKAIVLCISCHRAHGSPYDDLLRWDYNACRCGQSSNSSTTCGCFACHTTK